MHEERTTKPGIARSLLAAGVLCCLHSTPTEAQQTFTTDVQIAKSIPELYFTDTTHGKRVSMINRGGDLHISSFISSSILAGLPSGLGEIFQDNVVIRSNGNVGIGNDQPAHRLRIKGGPPWTSSAWQGAIELDNAAAIGWRANSAGRRFGMGHTNGGFYFFHTDSDPGNPGGVPHYDLVINDDASVSVNVLHVASGADISERFAVRADQAGQAGVAGGPLPGTVVSIDRVNPGELVVSSSAYDRRVAGIISGAGGLRTGMLLGQTGSIANGAHPVALSGRVYGWVDASAGAVEPGDLLTSSDRPGHAMKVVDHARSQGAILGKAMSSLKEGQGLVLILVSLQ